MFDERDIVERALALVAERGQSWSRSNLLRAVFQDARIAIFGRGLDRNGLATAATDLTDNVVRVNQIVDNNLGSMFGKEQAVSSAKSASR